MNLKHFAVTAAAVMALASAAPARACTNILVSRGASADDSTMVTYAADGHTFYGELYFTPARKHARGEMRVIRDWDGGKVLGSIPEPRETFRVVGNMNEHQLVIGETTFTGRKELQDPKGMIDYGSLIYVTLERARTAREAIRMMGDIVAAWGYASTGESFSIADPNETWIMDLIGKGPGNTGAVWVARRVPDGYISAHANQSRIRQFPLNDPENCLYSPDVIAFARSKGWFKGEDKDFSFADTYAPMTWTTLRTCEARVWNVFRRAAPSASLSSDYVKGVPGAQPMPLWIKPDRPLAAADVMALMRDHFEGTEFDMTRDVGAGPYALPYRWRPLTWTVDGVKYLNERAISTQQTGFSFVSQSRRALPADVGGLLWFGVDDTFSTVYVPIYAGSERVAHSYAVGTGSFTDFSWDSAFWVFNWVANQAYARYSDIIVDIQRVQRELEGGFVKAQPELEAKAAALWKKSPAAARRMLTDYSVKQADSVVARWRTLGQALFVKYLDGNVRDEKGEPQHPPYSEEWRRRIALDTGARLKVAKLPGEPEEEEPKPAPVASAVPTSNTKPAVAAQTKKEPTMHLDMIGLVVKDMAASLKFYRALGLAIPEAMDREHHVEHTLPNGLRIGWDTIDVVKSFDPNWTAPKGSGRLGFAFACADAAEVDATYKRLVAGGVTGHKEPWDAFWGQRYAQVKDPDGNSVDLFAWLPGRKP